MAEAVVTAVVADVVGRAISLLAGQLRDRRGVDGNLQRLRRLVVKLESAVDAADARRITSRALLEWLSELVVAAHRGRYFLDAFGGHGESSSFSPSSFNPAKRLRVAARRMLSRGGSDGGLDGVLASMERVSGDLAEFIMLLQCCPPALHRPLATNMYADCQVFGRHLERRRVIDFLLHDDGDDGGDGNLGVLPIIGHAGMGKTTLVQHVCDEPAVRRRFSLILLLDFHSMSLTVASETVQLLRSLFTVAGTASTGELLRLLEQKLHGERFLAVFDNVDERRKQVMDDAIMPALRRGQRGSRVIVTGSSSKHVAGLGTTAPVVLRPLPPAEYWFFFKAHAFAGAEDGKADPRLAAAGQAIAERLGGSFFAGKVVGALLRSRPDHRLWRRVLAASHGEPSWLGSGGYVAAAAGSLLPPHVTVSGVAVSGSPVRGLVGLQDVSLTVPPRDGCDSRPELPVLLCKSVFPSYCLYYTAYCTVDRDSGQ